MEIKWGTINIGDYFYEIVLNSKFEEGLILYIKLSDTEAIVLNSTNNIKYKSDTIVNKEYIYSMCCIKYEDLG